MKYTHIHFVGIKGVGMTPLAIIAKEAGCRVTGSDIAGDFITKTALDKAGITPYVGFSKEHIHGAELIITTGAHGGQSNIEVVAATKLQIPVLSHGEALGKYLTGELFGKSLKGIAVAGTHGKTTTTALIATILMDQHFDPSYVIGTSQVPSLQQPGHFGNGEYFVVEADEYATDPIHNKKARFLWLNPEIAIITNIDHDHPDIYPTIDAVRVAFQKLTEKIKPTGILIACGDDEQVQLLLRDYKKKVVTYGFAKENDYVIDNLQVHSESIAFRVRIGKVIIGEFRLKVFGEHNVLNALAAIIVCLQLGVSVEKIAESLEKFDGTKRRFEYIGKLKTGALLFDDYAHHPTEIQKSLAGAKQRFPQKKIIPIFQPHTYSRTKELFHEFAASFTDAHKVVLTDIYASLREKPDPSISVKALADEMKEKGTDVIHLPLLTDVVEYLNKTRYGSDIVLVTMGAGDIYTISERIALQHG